MSISRTIFILVTLLLGMQLNAQVKDPAAKELIDKMAAKAKSYPSIITDFHFYFENEAEDIKEEYTGKAWIKGDMYKISLLGQIIISDGKTIWTILEDVGEVNIVNRDLTDDSFLNNPAQLFANYEKDFKFKYVGEEKHAKGQAAIIELYPAQPEQGLKPGNKKNSDLSRIRLLILKSNADLLSARYYSQGGTNYHIVIDKLVTNQALTAKDFTFYPASYPKMEIIDLRE